MIDQQLMAQVTAEFDAQLETFMEEWEATLESRMEPERFSEESSEFALAGRDGQRAESLLKTSKDAGTALIAQLAEKAVRRLLASPNPQAAPVLFDDAELGQLRDSFVSTIATADLLGRSRVREKARIAEEFGEQKRKDQWVSRKISKLMAEGKPQDQAVAIALSMQREGKDTDDFAEYPAMPDNAFYKFEEPVPVIAPAGAVDYFRRLVPSLGVDPMRYGPLLERHAFTLAAATDKVILDKVKQAITARLAGTAPISTAPADIQAILDAAGVSPANPQYSEMVWRTNAMDAYNQGATAELQSPDMADAFPVWRYEGILDSRTGDDHRPKIGLFFPTSAAFPEVRGPRVFNCLLPGQFVQGRVKRGLKAVYAGEAIEIHTARGCRLAVTTNHPVLTERGFVPAGELVKGQHLLHYGGEGQVVPVLGKDDQDTPALIEDVFEAMTVLFGRPRSAPIAALDFHGDGARCQGEIDVVGADILLGHDGQSGGRQRGCQPLLSRRIVGGGLEPRRGPHRLDLWRILHAAAGLVGGRDLLASFHRRHFRPLQQLRRGPIADGNARSNQPVADDSAGDVERLRDLILRLTRSVPSGDLRHVSRAESCHPASLGLAAELDAFRPQPTADGFALDAGFASKLLCRFPGKVSLDEATEIVRLHYDGPVFDVETDVGYYVANSYMVSNGIIISNCRCTMTPVYKSEWAEMRRGGAKLETRW